MNILEKYKIYSNFKVEDEDSISSNYTNYNHTEQVFSMNVNHDDYNLLQINHIILEGLNAIVLNRFKRHSNGTVISADNGIINVCVVKNREDIVYFFHINNIEMEYEVRSLLTEKKIKRFTISVQPDDINL